MNDTTPFNGSMRRECYLYYRCDLLTCK